LSNQPITFIAGRSHAAYPHGDQKDLEPGVVDHYEGDGIWKILPLETITSDTNWTTWHGRWGASTEGEFKSPANPSEQGDKWARPSKFHNDHSDEASETAPCVPTP
jgi:hypothetical protein